MHFRKILKCCFLFCVFPLVISCAMPSVQDTGFLQEPLSAGEGATIALAPVVTGLEKPVAITHAGDGSGRLFITIQTGKIVIYEGAGVLPVPFLDISGLVSCCDERGLLSTAFHPGYSRNGRFFVNYTNSSGDTVVAEYRVSDDPYRADPDSASVLLVVLQPTQFHNGGQLQFGPDGYLYIGMGDGGSYEPGTEIVKGDNTALDALHNAQDMGKLLGKLLRIDVDGGRPYAVPPTNPFAGMTGVRGEIWSSGLRNPWRFSFDRLTGDLFIADVGRNSFEEVDFQPASGSGGENYGWPVMEGTLCHGLSERCEDGELERPVLEYDHSEGCAIIGGYRYRGSMIPALNGVYIYGDFCTGKIWGAFKDGDGKWVSRRLLDTKLSISAFGEDGKGDIYVADYGGILSLGIGAVYRIVPISPTPRSPRQ